MGSFARIFLSGLAVIVLVAAVLAITTQIGVTWLKHKFPARGTFVKVDGARLHVDAIGPENASGLPIVMIPGASSSIETMRYPLGEALSQRHRVILIDRPGQGWSTRERRADSTPMIHARMIAEALNHLNIGRAIFVGHSWGGAVLPALALLLPEHVAGLVMISAVTHPWDGDVDWIYRLLTVPVVGPVLAHTVVLPYGLWILDAALRYVFAPQEPPAQYADLTQVEMVLRPDTFLNNAWDMVSLHAALAKQSANYPKIIAPVTLIAGGQDQVVSTDIHSRQLAKSVRESRLVVLPKSGHMPQVAEASFVQKEIEDLLHRNRSSALDHARN